jgi:hypothetical protein
MATVQASVEAQSKALAAAADAILTEPKVQSRRFVPLSSAEAVIRYAGDFTPSWAGAISIDLLPAVLVFILAVAHRAMRRDADALEAADTITAAEMMRAVEIWEQMKRTQAVTVADDEDAGSAGAVVDVPPVVERPDHPTVLRPVASARIDPSTKTAG